MINKVHIVASAIAQNQEGEILMVQEGKEHVEDTWNFPGGSLESNEDIEECAKREFIEETGRSIKIEEAIGVYLEESIRTGNTVAVFLFRAEIREKKNEGLENGEIKDSEYFKPEEIRELELRKENRQEMLDDFLKDRSFDNERIVETRT